MSRIARVVAVGLPHHITQKGNYGQKIFLNADDKIQYLNWVQEYSLKYQISILAYCLMSNHVHFIVIPFKQDSLARVFNTAHMRYSQYFNKKSERRGHLWQGRFYSCTLDESHLLLAARYIERNPVRAGIVKKPWAWPWSSAAFHVGRRMNNQPIKLGNFFGITGIASNFWEEYIDSNEEVEFLNHIRKYTFSGRPLGKPTFIEKLQRESGRKLSVLPIGRPKSDRKIVAVPIKEVWK